MANKFNILLVVLLVLAPSTYFSKKIEKQQKQTDDFDLESQNFVTVFKTMLLTYDADFSDILSDLESLEGLFDEMRLFEQNNAQNFSEEENYEKELNLFCAPCKYILNQVYTYDKFKVKSGNFIEVVLAYYFGVFNIFTPEVAFSVMQQMVPSITYSLWDHYLEPQFLCQLVTLCKRKVEVWKIKDIVKEILADKPVKQQLVPSGQKTIKFLHITDIHTDSKYTVGAQAHCQEGLDCCLPGSTPEPTDDSQKAQYWGTLAPCDIPERTLDQGINYIKKYLADDLDFAIWTGDNAPHDIWEQDKESNVANTVLYTQKFKEQLPNLTFFPIFGNHEEYPVNMYNFWAEDKERNFNQVFADAWRDWIGEDSANQLESEGFYEHVNEELNLKFIAMNTQACDANNFLLIRNPTDPNQMLEKMRASLYESEQNDQAVYIFSHIPVGNGCLNKWEEVFTALVERFSYNIRGIFAGHTHTDSFGVINNSDGEIINNYFVAPSFTTHENKNPSFRVFEADAETLQILNIHQYRLDINYWNQFTDPNTELLWEEAYDFISEYNLTNMWDPKNLGALREQIGTNLDVYNKYVSNYYTGNYEDSDEIDKRYYCNMLPTRKQSQECRGKKYSEIAVEWLAGPWLKKKSKK